MSPERPVVDEGPVAWSERWASRISSSRSYEAPSLILVMAVIVFIGRGPAQLNDVQMALVGFLVAQSFFLWERRGFRRLLARRDAELAGRTSSGRSA